MKRPASMPIRLVWCGALIPLDTSHHLCCELDFEECCEGLSSVSDSLMQLIFSGLKNKKPAGFLVVGRCRLSSFLSGRDVSAAPLQ